MPARSKIAFIGAGSTVFMKNIIGDVLQRPALAGARRSRSWTSTRSGWPNSEVVAGSSRRRSRRRQRSRRYHRPAAGARGRRLRRRRLPDRRLRALHRHRFRGAEEATACARPSPTRSASAASCAACAPCRISGRSCARHAGASAPTRSCCNMSTRWRSTPGRYQPKYSGHQTGRALPLGAGHRVGTGARPRHPGRGDPLPRGRHQPHGLLSEIRASPGGRFLSRPLSATCRAAIARAASPSRAAGIRAVPTRCATRC